MDGSCETSKVNQDDISRRETLAFHRLHHFKFKMKFLPSKNIAQVKLPKLSGEPPTWPALIEISNELHTKRSPKISQANVRSNGPKLDRRVEGKRSALGHEAGERITIEVITMRGIGGPVRVCVMRRDDLYPTTRFRNAMKLGHKRHHIGNVFDDVAADDFIKLIVGKRIGHISEVVNHVRVGSRI